MNKKWVKYAAIAAAIVVVLYLITGLWNPITATETLAAKV